MTCLHTPNLTPILTYAGVTLDHRKRMHMLELNRIEKHFSRGGNEFIALRGVSLVVEPGDVFGILGPNGAGKTTLMRILTTALKPSAGTGSICGYDLLSQSAMVRRMVGFVSGDFNLYNRLTGYEYLSYFGELNGMAKDRIADRISELSSRFQMDDFLGRRCGSYSSGMCQKMSISRAILHSPRLLLLDEATTNLDIQSARELVELVRTHGNETSATVYTTHRLSELEKLCNKLLVIIKGCPHFVGTIDEFRNRNGSSIEDAYLNLLNQIDNHSNPYDRGVK